jgi:hypothetical protein
LSKDEKMSQKEGTHLCVALGVPTLNEMQDSLSLLNLFLFLFVPKSIDVGIFFIHVD